MGATAIDIDAVEAKDVLRPQPHETLATCCDRAGERQAPAGPVRCPAEDGIDDAWLRAERRGHLFPQDPKQLRVLDAIVREGVETAPRGVGSIVCQGISANVPQSQGPTGGLGERIEPLALRHLDWYADSMSAMGSKRNTARIVGRREL